MRWRCQRGAVLILVLWIVLLLTVLLAAFGAQVRVEKNLADATVQQVRARAAAEAVLHYLAAYNLAAPSAEPVAETVTETVAGAPPAGLAAMVGIVYALPVADVTARFRLLPEDAFLSLNGATRGQLVAVLSALDPDADAQRLADLIVDWRDPDSEPGEQGAEQADYEALGLDYGPANGPFRRVDELLLLPGFPRPLLDALTPLVTVDGDHQGVSPRFAPPQLLAALFGESLARTLAPLQGLPGSAQEVEQVMTGWQPPGDDAEGGWVSGGGGSVYRVQVEVLGAGRVRQVEATASFDGGDPPFRVLRWSEYTSRFYLPNAAGS